MTDKSFDQLTKLVSRSTSRRGLLKGAAAAALSGVAMRLRGENDAAARARVKMACARLGQPCDTVVGTPGNMLCCPGLACDMNGETLSCCKPENESCIENSDCCSGSVCRPNPTGLGNRCLPPGDVGAECIEDADCASNLCDIYSGTCLGNGCGATCVGDPYALPEFCGADSRTNNVCACYPTTDQTCACSASNNCGMTSGGCASNADCDPGEVCIVPLGIPDICDYGQLGVCGLACDFQGSPYIVPMLEASATAGWWSPY